MKRILIPTDFSENSIYVLERLREVYPGDYSILFTHLFYLPDSIQELMFSSYRVNEFKFITPEFRKAYAYCMAGSKTRTEVPVKFFYGNTIVFFKNFLEANGIDLIVHSEKNPVKKLSSESIDVNRVIFKCGVELLNVDSPFEQFAAQSA